MSPFLRKAVARRDDLSSSPREEEAGRGPKKSLTKWASFRGNLTSVLRLRPAASSLQSRRFVDAARLIT